MRYQKFIPVLLVKVLFLVPIAFLSINCAGTSNDVVTKVRAAKDLHEAKQLDALACADVAKAVYNWEQSGRADKSDSISSGEYEAARAGCCKDDPNWQAQVIISMTSGQDPLTMEEAEKTWNCLCKGICEIQIGEATVAVSASEFITAIGGYDSLAEISALFPHARVSGTLDNAARLDEQSEAQLDSQNLE